MKQNDINLILEDFFGEILKEIDVSITNYKKSNDDKYLTQIKNITGNSLNDAKLKSLISKSESDYKKELEDLFLNKKQSRIDLLGSEENKILEKKIFLQIIDYSWRSHLQYLEQLRQVIGLRQYGQKDPLSEFKKEAFVLFEGLLTKIKYDVIRLLLNLNIVVSSKDENKDEKVVQNKKVNDYKKVGRNEKCPCGSGKKFKHCHGSI